jgi:hypothetical protein
MASSAGKLFRPERWRNHFKQPRRVGSRFAANLWQTLPVCLLSPPEAARCGYQTHVAPFWRLAAWYDEFQMMTSAAISSMHKIMRRPMRFIVDPAAVL